MAIRQVIVFQVQSGTGAQFTAGFAPIIAKVQREPGCEQYELMQAVSDPDRFVMLERWANRQAMDDALKRLYPGKDHPSIAFFQLLVGAPQKEVYEV